MPSITSNSLVLYKGRPARVRGFIDKDKIEIEVQGGDTHKVRPKDVTLLHPGPLNSLGELRAITGDVETAWELLAGGETNLRELAELVFDRYTPATAWAAWQLAADSVYFKISGDPDPITACTPEEVARQQASRQAQAAEQEAWTAFLERTRQKKFDPGDARYLREVEDLALGRRTTSRVMRELSRAERPESAHAFLLELGYWDVTVNPYPARFTLPTSQPESELPELPEDTRLDLTHLPAFAIDDEGNTEPDDALSLEERPGQLPRLWVHVADVAALAPPGSPADLEARARGANLYLPEGTITMLPEAVTLRMGLGLNEVSPALSFGIDLDDEGQIVDVQVAPSWVRVERLTYEQALNRISQPPLSQMYEIALRCQARRVAAGAVMIDLPETKVWVENGLVRLRPVLPLPSRVLVREAMLLAGEAAARFAMQHGIPAAYAVQDPSTLDQQLTLPMMPPDTQRTSFAYMYALRRAQNRGQVSSQPRPHAGAGLPAYVRVTSPLRRAMDLVAHQQLRAFLQGRPPLDEQEMLERVGASEAVTGAVNQAENRARRHWTLVYLLQHPNWQGEGVLVDKRGGRGRCLLPELALETTINLRKDLPLDTRLPLAFKAADLPELETVFHIAR